MSNLAITALVASLLFASAADAQSTEQAYLDFQVDKVVRVRTPAAPTYPQRLRDAKVEGEVLVQFVVDEKGSAQMSTFKVLRATDPLFVEAVRKSISFTSFSPAEIDGRKVKQVVQQPFKFTASR
jgi:periplasmic protein TonB